MRSVRTIIIFDCFIYGLCLLGLWQVEEKADFPFNISRQSDGTFIVSNCSLQQTKSPVLYGDRVLSINGVKPNSLEDIEYVLDGTRIHSAAMVKVERNTTELDIPVTLVHAYGGLYTAVAWFVGTLFFLSGLVVLVYKRYEIPALVYHFGAVGVAAIIMMTWGCYAITPAGTGQLIRAIFSIAYVCVPVLLLHLSLVFPTRREKGFASLVLPLYAIALVLSICMSATFFKATLPFSMQCFHSFMFFFNVTRCVYAACVAASVLFFIASYRSSREEMEKRQLRWVFLGLAISSLGFVSLWQVPELLTSRGLVREEFVILLSSATPITFTVAIVKYHLLDINLIVKRSTAYIAVLAIILSIYAVIVGLMSALIGHLTLSLSVFISAFAAVIVALLFEPVRRKIQTAVDKSFFRISYDVKEVENKFINNIKICVTADALASLVIKTIMDALPVQKIGFFVLTQPGNRLHLLAHKNFDIPGDHSIEFHYSELRNSLSLPVVLDGRIEPGANFEKANPEVFHRWGMTVVLSMKSRDGNTTGFLVLGEKKSGLRYSIEDIDLLSMITRQTELAYDRILIQKSLVFEHEERERLEELNRLKTYFVSSVSHDLKTPLSAIRIFTEMLDADHRMSPRKFHHYLETIDGESKRLTRLIDNVLTVAKSERSSVIYDLKKTKLDDVVKRTIDMLAYELRKEECQPKVRLHAKNYYILGDEDALAEALANLILNAAQYSKKKKLIQIETFNRDGLVCLSVRDHGVGIPQSDIPHVFEPFYRGKEISTMRPGGTGLGLSVVKSIMDAHNGNVEIESSHDSGTKVTLSFRILEKP